MDFRPSDALKARLRAEISAYYENRKRECVRELDLEHQQALEDFDRRWSLNISNVGENKESAQNPSQSRDVPAAPQTHAATSDGSASNGSSDALTKRQMMLMVMPEFRGGTFTQGDLKAKILERWPEADSKYLASRVSQLLKLMWDEGRIERIGRGERIRDPFIYREVENNEESLLGP